MTAPIRLARCGDVGAILEISNWAAANTTANFAVEPERLDAWIEAWSQTHERFPWNVADLDGSIVGFARAMPHSSRCAYDWVAETSVYVHPDHHRRGLGRALLAGVLDVLARQGYRSAVAIVAGPNRASERLHTLLGFRRVGALGRVGWKFGAWHDVGYWQKDLDDSDGEPDPILTVASATAPRP